MTIDLTIPPDVTEAEDLIACEDCESTEYVTELNGGMFCPDCRRDCAECDRTIYSDDTVIISAHRINRATGYWGYEDLTLCTDCASSCESCGEWALMDNLVSIGYGYYCENCYSSCENCGEYMTSGEDYCEDCDSGDHEGINSYGQTQVTKFFGGPLPKDDKGNQIGAYIGLELEISAEGRYSAMPVHDWASRHGHDGMFDCKEDSSVEGFEIVTQPMTPAYFESVDWDGFFNMLNHEYPLYGGNEPTQHGLHVHIGKVMFRGDDVAMAAYCYLMSQDQHLERISRRAPYHYCNKVNKPASVAIVANGKYTAQRTRLQQKSIYPGRDAINLLNSATIEIRAFSSTRSANEFRDAGRLTYVAAEYVKSLRVGKASIPPKALAWDMFARWTAVTYPEAFASIAGIATKGSNRKAV